MADDVTPTPPAAPVPETPAAPTVGNVQPLGGPQRITPDTSEAGKTLEQEAAEQALANETPEQKAAREEAEKAAPKPAVEETPEAKAAREAAEKAAKDAPVDLKGTVFEGLSPEMQGKIAPFAAAFSANGTLTDAEVQEAAHATGFTEPVIRQFMAGAQVTGGAETKPIFDQFGGEASFKEFQTWSREAGNLTAREEATINKALKAGDIETAGVLMEAPMSRWKEAGGGAAPRDVTSGLATGNAGAAESGDIYASWAQVTKDMGKPEYATDSGFRDKVQAKLARSPKLG